MSLTTPTLSTRQRFVNDDGTPTPEFFRTLDYLIHFTGFGSIVGITVDVSPFVYKASISPGTVLVTGGTVSAIELSRDGGTTYYNVGITSGPVRILSDDWLRVTYAVLPTMTWVPG